MKRDCCRYDELCSKSNVLPQNNTIEFAFTLEMDQKIITIAFIMIGMREA